MSEGLSVGPSASYLTFFGKDNAGFKADNAAFIPLAAAGRFMASDKFTVGLDLGYGIGISPDGNDGGFYYRPMVGYSVGDNMMVQATYSGISVEGGTFANMALGIVFGL